MSTTRSATDTCFDDARPIPFPADRARLVAHSSKDQEFTSDTDDVLDALQTVSRRITDLARELGCLGYFDDANDERPRAA
jgi:hypothetical protein